MADEVSPVGYTNGTTFVWNTKGQVIAAAALLPSLGVVLVALRFYSRIKSKAGLGVDDWLVVPALVIVVGLGVDLLVGVGKGVVAHTTKPNPDPSPEAQLYQITPEQNLLEKIKFVFYVIMVPAYGFIKLSVIFFYRRIFVVRGASPVFDQVTRVTIVIVILWTIAFFFAEIFKCGANVTHNWGPLINSAHYCSDANMLANGLFISDFLTDLFVLILPVPIIARLNMSTTRKLAVIAVLMLGTMSFCAAIMRMVFQFQITAAGLAKKTDVNEGLTTLLYWGMLEAGLSLIAVNLPSVYGALSRTSVQSIVASVRSAVSLHSLHSDVSRGLKKPYENIETVSLSSNAQPLNGQSKNSSQVYTGHEMDDVPPIPLSERVIHVKSELSQSEKIV